MASGQTVTKNDYTGSNHPPLRSMTGFAQVRRETSAGELSVSLRSVNHRGLDLHFYFSPDFSPYENSIRTLLKQRIGRGHVEIRASLTRVEGSAGISWNREALRAYVETFRRTAEEFQIDSKPDLNVLLTLPGVLDQARENARTLAESFASEFLTAFAECVQELNEY